MYIENSPRIELDALLMEMGIIDHEYKHGLHLYPGEEVVKVLSSPNVTMEMKEKLSIEVLSITTDEGKAKRVFQSIEAEISMSTIIGRSDVVLVILILTFISCVLVISILIGYFCCRRKGNKISFGNFSSNNNSTSSSVQVCFLHADSPRPNYCLIFQTSHFLFQSIFSSSHRQIWHHHKNLIYELLTESHLCTPAMIWIPLRKFWEKKNVRQSTNLDQIYRSMCCQSMEIL